jgi:hypothetical protein
VESRAHPHVSHGTPGRRAAKLILLAAVVAVAVPSTTYKLLLPHLGPDASISGCLAACPVNGLVIAEQPALALELADVRRFTAIAVALATGALLIWRLTSGTPPQRRAMAIGAPIALLFTAAQISYQVLKLAAPDAAALHNVIQWTFAAARSSIWYGFLFALIAAQLFAGRTLHGLVRQSLRRPSQRELEAMLRQPLGDPQLRLAFWDPERTTWAGADANGAAWRPFGPGSGRDVAVIERGDGQPAVAIDHDAQLADDPELLRAAGAVALLAAETPSSTPRGTTPWSNSDVLARESSPPATASGRRSSATSTTASSSGCSRS